MPPTAENTSYIKHACQHILVKRQVFFMKNFSEYVLIMIVFFIAALAFLEVDKRCGDMYGTGGKIAAEASEAASAAVRIMEAATETAMDTAAP